MPKDVPTSRSGTPTISRTSHERQFSGQVRQMANRPTSSRRY
jgi:hypothetical protein